MLPADVNNFRRATCFRVWLCHSHIRIIYCKSRWVDKSRSIFHQLDRLNHCSKSPLLCSLILSPWDAKKEVVSTCLLQSFIISLVWWRWSRCSTTWLCLHDHLRCKITGLTPREGLNTPLPLFLLCRPLRCVTFMADSIITAVWEGIKRDVACSFSHLQYWTSSCTAWATQREEEGKWTATMFYQSNFDTMCYM